MVCKRQPENGKVLSGCLTAAAVWVRRHQRGKFAAGFGAVFTSESGADAHDIVARGQAVFAASEPFADDALHVVAFYGALGSLFPDHQSQPCVPRRIGIGLQYLDEAAGTLLPKCENGRKFFRCEQSVCLAEAVVQFIRPGVCGLWRGGLPIRRGRRGFWSAPKSRACVCVW